MAKNWTLKEAVAVITKGTNKEAIQELGKKFPLTSIAIAKMGTNAGIETLFGAMPDHMTVLKMERSLKEGLGESEDEDVEDVNDQQVEADNDDEGTEDLQSMTSKQLYELCTKKGIKAKKYGVNKQYYLDLLNAGDADAEAEEDVEDAESEEPAYDEMNAMELYKLCKKRGIKAEPKKKASDYIKLLKKADEAAKAEADADEDEEDDWEEEKPAPKAKKATEKKEPKATSKKKVVEEDDEDEEDDDWDI